MGIGVYPRKLKKSSDEGDEGKKKKKSEPPKTRDSRDGYAKGGLTKVPRQDDNAALMQAGGYLGGLTETGRGTMAGELGRRGDMSVREAGETMHELARRRRGV